MHALEVAGLVKSYDAKGSAYAVDHVDLSIDEGQLLVLLGPSGCGKTTLLRCIAGLEHAQAGTIRFAGTTVFDGAKGIDLPTHKRDIGMVFQNYSLWPHMTVEGNVAYPLKARNLRGAEVARRTAEALSMVRCSHLATRLPAMLSGGQQQRVALARALVPRPALMLLDEPLSNLDALLRVDLRVQLRSIQREINFTGIYVTHDQSEAFALGSKVAVMHSGRIEQIGTPRDIFERPASDYVAEFLGVRNCLHARRCESGWTVGSAPLLGDTGQLGDTDGELRIYLRPERVRLLPSAPEPASGALGVAAVVEETVYNGSVTEYVLRAGAAMLHATIPGHEAGAEPGAATFVTTRCADTLVYDGSGRLLR